MKRSPVVSHELRRNLSQRFALALTSTTILSVALWWLANSTAEGATSKPSVAPESDFTPGAFFFGCLLAALLGVIVLIITAIRGNSRR